MIYAVTWSNGRPGVVPGSLEVGHDALLLRGGESLDLPYDQIERAHMGRGRRDRVGGRKALVLELASGDVVRIASMNGPGTLGEVAERAEALVRHAAGG